MRVREVMQTQFDTVSPETTLREAAVLFRSGKGQGEGGVPALVVMEGEKLSGIISLTDVLKAILPPYILQDPHLAHMAWDGLLEAQCEKIQNKQVREIMTKQVLTIAEEAVLAEAAEHFLSRHIHSLPVTRGGKVVGILYLSDLARRVLGRCEGGAP
jgi:CBS domain-containing protein